ncbi:VOC family protein [Saccharomonospora saliphila]|uniref:VOC family protein n=1 Tax=Saccharomonospora saliphila TaxID=369829 RepID=UPI0003627A0B|nr:VOC family protein [Saccharomonospora saliphila]
MTTPEHTKTTTTGTTGEPATGDAATSPRPGPGVWPALRFSDAEAARRLLVDVLGFTETRTITGENGEILHGELRWPEGGGVMYGSAAHREPNEAAGSVGGHAVYVVTADPDAVAERARRAGARLIREPMDTDYGSRETTVADPDGNAWNFGTYPGA